MSRKNKTSDEYDREAMVAFKAAPVTVEDLARAWASMDGKDEAFDAGKDNPNDETGHYDGYCVEAREIIERATKYALKRKT